MSVVAGAIDARGSRREKIFYRTRVSLPDGSAVAATLVDVSAGGFMARCDAVLDRGDRMWLDLPLLGRVMAEVRWALGGRFGCRWDLPLVETRCAELVPLLRGANDL